MNDMNDALTQGPIGNELTGRSLLPNLQQIFIPNCFREGQEAARASIQGCLVESVIPHYTALLMGIAALVSFAFIIRGGYLMFTAFGDESKYAQGKKTLLHAIIGFIIAMLSAFLVTFFVNLLRYEGSLPWSNPGS